jgi:hypothetical protein
VLADVGSLLWGRLVELCGFCVRLGVNPLLPGFSLLLFRGGGNPRVDVEGKLKALRLGAFVSIFLVAGASLSSALVTMMKMTDFILNVPIVVTISAGALY